MLYLFGFETVGVVVGDLYFVDPDPAAGQEGAERGVRLEVRVLERGAPPGSVYSAIPIAAMQPIWRADLLETVDGEPGSHDRTHHHPTFRGWEPSSRRFDELVGQEPVAWVGEQLADLDALIERSEVDASDVDSGDAGRLRASVPEILTVVRSLLERVRAGELGIAPAEGAALGARSGWL
ncbi:MAG: hypothetical protein ABW073_01620 [Acidimicrobiia bacterium]